MTARIVFLCFQIIDPYVEVEIIGLPGDCCKQQTRVVDDNGERVFRSRYTSMNNHPTGSNFSSLVAFRFQSHVGGDARF